MWRKYAEITEYYGVNLAGISCWTEIFLILAMFMSIKRYAQSSQIEY